MIDTKGLTPVVIGCKGGSGSRVLRDLLTVSPQIFMDQLTSANSKDSRKCAAFTTLAKAPFEARLADFERFVHSILQQIPADRLAKLRYFGWKRPMMVRHVGFLFRALPEMRFLHLIRDPAAVATGRLWRKGYKRWLMHGKVGPDFDYYGVILQRWVVANLPVWRRFKDNPNYRLVRYEDLVLNPRESVPALFAWMGVTEFDLEAALAMIRPPDNALERGSEVDLSPIAAAVRELGYGHRLEQQ